jgi:hypothetical protein
MQKQKAELLDNYSSGKDSKTLRRIDLAFLSP